MSPTVNNFVHDLVAMAKAMEDLPQVQAALTSSEAECNKLASAVASREEHILSLKAEIDAHLATIRKVEAERDSAETMFLEADDRTSKALAFVRVVQGDAEALVRALSPVPAPANAEVKPEPEPMHPFTDQSADPLPSDATNHTGSTSASETVNENGVGAMADAFSPSQGQSEPLPTSPDASMTEGNSASLLSGTIAEPSAPAPTQADASSEADPFKLQPYVGKRYYSWPVYVPRSEWIAGGGTDASYDSPF